MSKLIQSIRGMHDILPQDSGAWHWLETVARNILERYGYQEIRMPLVEKTELFKRSIGEVTDIVEKEMYSFQDRNGESLSLRPEGTAGCVRAGLQHGLLYGQQQRLWYQGPMFRHERPQKGRYRQFHQIGVETFGFAGPQIEAELIALSARLWHALGLPEFRLEINSLGSPEARRVYREQLVNFYRGHFDELDADSQRRLESNPLRILDSKHPQMQALNAQAPSLQAYLDDASQAHFEQLQQSLDALQIAYTVNPRLVRGLDYYSHTVFEWITDELGAQGTVCAGGRYDGLVTQLGGKPVPAAGFALGVERLLELARAHNTEVGRLSPHAYLILAGRDAEREGAVLAEQLRSDLPGLRLVMNASGGSFKAQMKRADKSGAAYALILGDNEIEQQTISLKPLRTEQFVQQAYAYAALCDKLSELIGVE